MLPYEFKENTTLSNGVEMPTLAFGCAFGNWTDDSKFLSFQPDLAWSIIPQAIEAGFRHFDTALIYGTHHILGNSLGRFFASGDLKREDVFITSKVFHPQVPLALNAIGNSWDLTDREIDVEKRVLHDFERCLAELNIGYLDLLLIHWPGMWDSNDPSHGKKTRKRVWKAFETIYKSGKVRAIGVSNFMEKHFDFLDQAEVTPMLNQMEVNPYIQQTATTDFCRKKNILVESWGPFGSGTTGVLTDPLIQSLGEKYNKNVGQIILRWLGQKGFAAAPKSSNIERMRCNLNIFDFELDREDMKKIDSLERHKSSVCTSESIA